MNYPIMTLKGYTIYKKPAAHPDHFVVIKWRTDSAGIYQYDRQMLAGSLEEARIIIFGLNPKLLQGKMPDPFDHETIVESWV